MRLKLYEDAIKAKAQKKASRRNSRRSPTPQDEPTDADAMRRLKYLERSLKEEET